MRHPADPADAPAFLHRSEAFAEDLEDLPEVAPPARARHGLAASWLFALPLVLALWGTASALSGA